MKKPMWDAKAVKAYETGQGVELVNDPHPHYEPVEQPKVRTGDCLLVGVCASEGHKIQPQRTWVELTEAECGVLWKVGMTPFDYYQAIEAKLKEKNNG